MPSHKRIPWKIKVMWAAGLTLGMGLVWLYLFWADAERTSAGYQVKIADFVQAQADWLTGRQQSDGWFDYADYQGEPVFAETNSIARQSSALWALNLYAFEYDDAEARGSACRVAGLISSQIWGYGFRSAVPALETGLAVWDAINNQTSNEATAYYLLAVLADPACQVWSDPAQDWPQRLGEGALNLQAGQFYQSMGNTLVDSLLGAGLLEREVEAELTAVQQSWLGSSMLALLHLEQQSDDLEFSLLLDDLFALVVKQSQSTDSALISFYPYGMQAVAEWYKQSPTQEKQAFMVSQTDKLLSQEAVFGQIREFWDQATPIPKGHAAVYLPALLEVYDALRIADPAKAEVYLDNILMTMAYLLFFQTPLQDEYSAEIFDQVQGSLCYDYYCTAIRVDYVGQGLLLGLKARAYLPQQWQVLDLNRIKQEILPKIKLEQPENTAPAWVRILPAD